MNTGMVLIWAAGAAGLLAFLTSLFYYFRGDRKLKALSEKLELAAGVGIVAATLLLTHHLLSVDTEYAYVFQHSSTDLSWHYQLSALWAGQEGSFLLWTAFIFIMLAVTRFTGNGKALRDTKFFDLMRSVVLFVTSAFLLLLVLKNPFSMYYFPGSGIPEVTNWNPFVEPFYVPYGQGMNPLLRNPWMAVHPPVLFLGYAAFTLPFSAAIAGLVLDDKRWERVASGWMRFSWLFLTLGIGFGGFWAYEVLGWGAWYWTWDPVETSSLIPWIAATAYLHAKLRYPQGEYGFMLPLLALVSFVLVIFSTFVTRSGLWASVHSWQDFTTEGMVIAFFLLVLTGSSAGLLAKKYFSDD
ncbi:heme lyase CcmF/NrfE family subunit [Methanosarcina sp. KYL-1]|uniref:cytochrome c biogenesis protein CcsA n=1 Tax=Methanosarcina sp. KYL-1 TaxID=2602068 RepID=UPI0021019B47|nr:cytochrome c biogenesis protein CcsA [Methanosarcina sp. KYL-1]MCQ1536370.1 heme lyase CcmF/NrfE family subunit [Methanosarcina sp. KYL-1]